LQPKGSVAFQHQNLVIMKKIFSTFFFLTIITYTSFSQLTMPPDGGNKKAMIFERIGITDVTIHYDRPAVKGREGKIWGQLIPIGFTDPGFGTSKAAPWRAGANENTTIEFSTDVKIEGQPLPAGKYGFFVAYDPNESILIFSKNNTSWGSFFYDEKEDVLRVKIKPVSADKSVERLKYEFQNETDNSATIALQWEKMIFPFKVEVDLDKLQFESFRRELRGERSFSPGWQSYQQAALYASDHNTNLEEGLKWADQAINDRFVGEVNFVTLSTKATILTKLGRTNEADTLMKKALPMGNAQQVHQYGRQLLAQKKYKEALDIFKFNYQKNPGQFTTMMGMARGYSGVTDFPNALKYANMALNVAPDPATKKYVEDLVGKLKEKKDIN
jgi:tetratricopeptide (TPR) repeat protein